jgi:D-glycero-alpha-D-manno-heptose 1-phosphate guanylyltransferase
MKAFILCGGFGSRLRNVIGNTQKAVAMVGGRPFLHIVIDQLTRAGIEDLVLCTHYQSTQVEHALSSFGGNVARNSLVVCEQIPLGTGGAILNAIVQTQFRGDLIVINADTYVASEAYSLAMLSSSPSLVVSYVDDCKRFGAIQISSENNVIGISEKGVDGEGLVSMGIYRFHTNDLHEFPLFNCSMEIDILPHFIMKRSLKAVCYSGPFIDIGTPQSFDHIRNFSFLEQL